MISVRVRAKLWALMSHNWLLVQSQTDRFLFSEEFQRIFGAFSAKSGRLHSSKRHIEFSNKPAVAPHGAHLKVHMHALSRVGAVAGRKLCAHKTTGSTLPTALPCSGGIRIYGFVVIKRLSYHYCTSCDYGTSYLQSCCHSMDLVYIFRPKNGAQSVESIIGPSDHVVFIVKWH